MRKLFGQALRFLAVSGTGWFVDFSAYWALTLFLGLPVSYANMLSSIPAITLVFLVSTHKIFVGKKEGLPLWGKYLVYFGYQIVLVFCVSWLGEWLYRLILGTSIMGIAFAAKNLKVICKILITPVTMTINFVVMKILCEKL